MLHQIGNGALGPVFRAYDQDRDRLVAVKLFRLDLPPEKVHQLVAEFEKLIASDLQHPVIASPRATGIDGNSAYLAQDFAAADSLDVVLRENGAAPPAQAIRVAGQLAEALDYAADRKVVHGALHPRDILLSQEDIRIVGLGVARALERVGVTAPVRRPYAPPERINDGGWDRSADVFSLAAIVYEMLCGKRVTGTGSEAADNLSEIPGGDMEALQRVFALALAADPSYRYSTASAFTDALKDAMGIEIAAAKPKARRRPKLRVVAPELPLDEVEVARRLQPSEPEVPEVPEVPEEVPEVQEVQQVLEVQEVPDEPEVPAPDPDPQHEEEPPSLEAVEAEPEPPVIRKPRRRRAPAPTPVAIETMATPVPPALSEVEGEPEPVIELVVMPEPEPVAELPMEFTPVEEPAPEPTPGPELFTAPEPAMIEPEPSTIDSVPLALSPEPYSKAPVWPIGVAAIIGIAVGFGVGYTVAIRDRVPPVVAASAPQPAAKEFTEVAAPAPTPVVEQKVIPTPAIAAPPSSPAKPPVAPKSATPKLTAKPSIPTKRTPTAAAKSDRKAAATAGKLVVESRPSGASVVVDGRHVGTTPLNLSDVKAGRHAIRLELDGYRIWTGSVSVSSGEQNRVRASLEK